jgi:hypothetical protein
MSTHIVLLGDSVFDNAVYVPQGHSVEQELSSRLDDGGTVTLLAQDGAVIRDVYGQLEKVPAQATALVLSVGGNDAVGHWSVLDQPAGQVRDGLERMGAVVRQFAQAYERLLDAALAVGRPLTVCTIYEGDFTETGEQAAVNGAVSMFDGAMYRAARFRGIDVIELRDICTDRSHFTQLIEPSAAGSRAIAEGIARHLRTR